MVSNPHITSLRSLTLRSRQVCQCSIRRSTAVRQFSNSIRRLQDTEVQGEERPRWSFTPPAMQAPFQPRIKDPTKAWEVNEDPAKVDAMYVKMLGRGGDKVLTDDIKWLAITHKSFDQGRRGFNDRLAFFGKRLLTLQANISLIHGASSGLPSTDNFDREPFSHPALEGLSNLENTEIGEIFSKDRMGQLARAYGIDQVTRWKPRIPKDLDASGCDVVYTTSLFAIVGAIALQRGGQMANEVARELVLKPLGI